MHVRPRLWWLSIVVAVCGVLALGLPGLARAATGPSIADLQSPSHPSATTWYRDANPTFSWAYGGIADQYAAALDHSLATVPDTSSPVDGLFGPQSAQSAGQGPASVALADVNGDGAKDLVVTNHLDDTVSVMLGNGDGTFGAQTTYDVGAGPEGVAVADLNTDGHLDIVTANHDDKSVSVLLGRGDGTFEDSQPYAIGSQAEGIAVADLNGDGNPDVVVVNHGDDDVGVLLGKGDGTLQTQVTYPVGHAPYRVAIADLGNGHADLIVTNYGDNDVGVLLGDGTGVFGAQSTLKLTNENEPIGVAVGDFNKDGKPDLAVTNAGSGTITIWLGNGDGTFTTSHIYGVGSIPWGITVGDFNGDGNLDLALTNHDEDTVSVLLGDGDGTFEPDEVFAVGGQPTTIAAADLNGDGSKDLVVSDYGDNDVSVLLAQTGGASYTGVADGSWYFHVRAHGDAGWGATETVQVNIDTTDPVTTAPGLSASGPGWSKDTSVTLDPTDASSGVAHTYYTLDSVQHTYSGSPFTVAEGSHTVTYWSVDNAGNVETHHTGYIDVDTTAPTTTATGLSQSPGPAWTKDGTFSLDPSDDSSAVAHTYYALDGGGDATYTAPVALSDGAHTVVYWSVDNAGNVETHHTGYIRVDKAAPALSISGASNGAWYRHAVTLNLGASDLGSGVATITYTLDGVEHVVTAATVSVPLPATPNAAHTVTWTATDAVGNRSAVRSVTVHIDTTAPATFAKAASGRHGHAIALRYMVRDNVSPRAIVSITIRTSSGKLVRTISAGWASTATWHSVKWLPKAHGHYRYSVVAHDLAGNHQRVAASAAVTVR